ncbi:hypothetical protein [Thiolapillus sp.]
METGNKDIHSELNETGLDAVSQESARQELDDHLESLQEREKGLKAMEEAQQLLEDQLEDANTEIDRLRRELDKAVVEAEESEYLRQETENARKQLENTLYSIQEGVEDAKVTDLRDERMHRRQGVVGIDAVTRGPFIKGIVVGIFFGSILALLVFEILAFANGKGEFISLLLNTASG